jgi:hypothetical protein
MSSPVQSCLSCSTPLDPNSVACSNCGHAAEISPPPRTAQQPAAPELVAPAHLTNPVGPPMQPPVSPDVNCTVRVVAAKSPGIAVVLSIWLGVGHLDSGKNGPGFALLALYGFLVLLSLVPALWVLTIPAWFIAFIPTAISASHAAKEFNHRNGIVVH